MEDTHMDDAADTAEAPAIFVPPSIDAAALHAGDSYEYYSPVPLRLQGASADAPGVPCVLGVDEAGRGPVLGPMVYGVFYAPAAEADVLLRGGQPADGPDRDDRDDRDDNDDKEERFRFDDSKVLAAATRAHLMAALCRPGSSLHRTCGWATAALSARDIAAGMLAPAGSGAGANLNTQAFAATVSLVRGVLARGVRLVDVFVDTVGPPATYQKRLEREFPGLRITVAKKADSLYPAVSAASVCAKVTRDVALETLYERHGPAVTASTASALSPDWGSGYPSDGRCTAWLRRNMHPVFGWGPECRFSWGTARDMLGDEDQSAAAKKKPAAAAATATGVRVDWPLPDDDSGSARLTEFFVTAPTRTAEAPPDELDALGAWFGRPVGLEAF